MGDGGWRVEGGGWRVEGGGLVFATFRGRPGGVRDLGDSRLLEGAGDAPARRAHLELLDRKGVRAADDGNARGVAVDVCQGAGAEWSQVRDARARLGQLHDEGREPPCGERA